MIVDSGIFKTFYIQIIILNRSLLCFLAISCAYCYFLSHNFKSEVTFILYLNFIVKILLFQGGMRAVIWTDVFQASIMFIGLFGSAVIGIVKIGSFEKVYNVTTEFKRLHVE